MVERLRPVRVSTVRIRKIFSGSSMVHPQRGRDDVRICAIEVNAHPDGTVIVLGASQRIKGHVSERRRTVGMLRNRQKYFSVCDDGAVPRLLNTAPKP